MTSRFAANLSAAGALCALAVLSLTSAAGASEDALDVKVDRASVIRMPAGASTVIVGNPLIADAATQRNGVLVVTGKSYGSTNIMLLDGAGEVLSETIVNVRRAQDGAVMIQRGAKRETLACTPRCEPVLAIGDSAETFAATAGQISQRNGMSTGSGPSQ